MPLVALIVLLYAVTAIESPFDAARSAILRDVVQGERYALAAAVLQSTFRLMIVVGAAAGGLVVAFVGARAALGIDAATFVVSAVVLQFGVRARPAAAAPAGPSPLLQLSGGRPGRVRGQGAAHPDDARLAGRLLRDPRGTRRALCGEARRRPGRGWPADRGLSGRRRGGDAGLHEADRTADAAALDGPDGGLRLRGARWWWSCARA